MRALAEVINDILATPVIQTSTDVSAAFHRILRTYGWDQQRSDFLLGRHVKRQGLFRNCTADLLCNDHTQYVP